MLCVQDIRKHFGGLAAVDGVSFQVAQGRVTAVIGPNGAGKTTLFNLISGVLPLTSGTVTFKDLDITGWPSHRIAQAGMSRTFQNIQLFANLNALENVISARFCRTQSSLFDALLGRDRRERRRSREMAEELLTWVGLDRQRFLMPRELPYGGQRRLEIARALATEPELLMLDEPTAGMSHQEAEDMMELIARLKARGTTIVLIEHNMHLVMAVSDNIVVLNFGRKIAEGSAEVIQTHPEVIEAYLGVEA